MSKNEYKIQKKLEKRYYKLEKKKQLEPDNVSLSRPSLYVRFAESIKGILYIVMALSIFAAIIMGQSGLILTIEDIIDSLIIATLGKALLVIIAVALFIYGLKNLGMMK